MKKISVIIPVYKVEQYLKRCVESVCKQTYRNLEIILIDDGSPDRSGALCDQFAQMDSRIKVIHKKNSGVSDTRNMGIESATGDYIAFLDGDDWYDSSMLEILLNICETYQAEIAECGYRNYYSDSIQSESQCTGQILELNSVQALSYNLDYKYCKSVMWDKLYRRDVIKNIQFPSGKIHEDEMLMFNLYLSANKIVYVDLSLYNYERRNVNSIMSSFTLAHLAVCEALRQKVHIVWTHPELSSIDEKVCNVYCWTFFDRLDRCIQENLSGPELDECIMLALEDYPNLKKHGIAEHYIARFEALIQKAKGSQEI